jgi:hypothetical protein
MRYHYESGFENFKKAQLTYMRNVPHIRVLFHFKIWGAAVLGIVLLLVCIPTAFAPGFSLWAFSGFMVGCGLLGGGIIGSILWPWQRRRAYRLWNGEDDVLNLYLEVDGPFLITGRPSRAESRFERAAICKVMEDDELILLFLGKKKFIYIPKTIGAPALADIHAWLALPGAPKSC